MSIELWPLEASRLGAAPGFLTFIATSLAGKEVRNPQSERRLKFNAGAGIKTLANVQLLIAWHAAMEGSLQVFLIKDWLDFEATTVAASLYNSGGVSVSTQGASTVTSTSTIFQLEKWYTVNSRVYKRRIRTPKSAIAVYFDGVLKTVATHYTVDYDTGLLTVVSGSPTLVTWTGEFYVPVRFEDDALPLDLLIYASGGGVGEVADVPLIEDFG